MSGPAGLRLGLAGATGVLGREVVSVLEDRRFPLRGIVPFATDHSIGEDVEIDGDVIAVDTAPVSLKGLDLLLVCTPPGPALDLVREALRAEVPCIDCSGALAGAAEVPLLVADLCSATAPMGQPIVASPAGPALAWAPVLSALDRAVGLERVTGTVLQSAARAGRNGIEALSAETIAVLGQTEMPEATPFVQQVAFDCIPASDADGDMAARGELELVRDLQRLLERPLPMAASLVQVPIFVGEGSALSIEYSGDLDDAAMAALFEKDPGVELWEGEGGPTTRDTAGRDVTLVGRVRRDTSHPRGLRMWLAADPLRLAASNAVKLAEARLKIQ